MEITEGKLKRLRNLPSFKDKTEEEIREYLKNKPEPVRRPRTPKVKVEVTADDKDYNKRYNKKLNQIVDEFGVDMNDANDQELVNILVRLSLQGEDVDHKIRGAGKFDTKTLKELGEYQKSVINAITDVQDKLGITRKVRKEKQVDDIPQYLKEIRRKAREFWNRTTSSVVCQKCKIELSRYWLNFPDLASSIKMELECWKCGEKTLYVK